MKFDNALTQAIYLLLRWHQEDALADVYKRELFEVQKKLTNVESAVFTELAMELAPTHTETAVPTLPE